MKLPNAENAFIDPRKLDEYLLNPDHERGKHKARVIAAATGITMDDSEAFRLTLLDAAKNGEAEFGLADDYGQRFVIEWELTGSTGTSRVRTAWIVRKNEDFPRFVTCHVT